MRTIARACFILGLFVMAALPLFGGSGSGADFLKIPIGAEPASLGQAYTAMANGIHALNWNPAGILRSPQHVQQPSMGLSLSHQDQFSENNLDHLGLIMPSKSRNNSWGLDLIRLTYAEQEARDLDRRKTGTISSSDLAFGLAYAKNLGPTQMGAQFKFIRQELAGNQANGFAVDLGFLSGSPVPRLSLGAAIKNLGPQMKFVQDSFNLPLTISVGGAYHLTGPLMLAMDVHHKPHQRQTVLAIGTQFSVSNMISLRAGFLSKVAEAVTNQQKSETNRGSFANVNGFTGGLGFQFKQLSLDYAVTPFGELGQTQMLTLSSWFGSKVEEKNSFDSRPTEVGTQSLPDHRFILILPLSHDKTWDSLSN
ncbi:MAG: hypothetical protein KCHDKBKB_02576 [Elusimicrobia bacterium]|nr:hypothetical protein [Elusimicrobiota bacterium]